MIIAAATCVRNKISEHTENKIKILRCSECTVMQNHEAVSPDTNHIIAQSELAYTTQRVTQHTTLTNLLRFLGLEGQHGGELGEGDVVVDAAHGHHVMLHHRPVQDAVPVPRHL